MMTMLDTINKNDKSKVFIRYFDADITYNDFLMYTNGLASQFSMYSDPHSIIAIISENIPQFIMVQYASWKNNCIFVPLSPLDSYNEIKDKVLFLNPKILIISSEFKNIFSGLEKITNLKILYTDPETFSKLPENMKNKFLNDGHIEELNLRKKPEFISYNPDIEDTAMMVFTSGTSGRQKAAVIKHKNIYAASYIYKEWFNVNERDINLAIAPFFHITGLIFGISLSVISGSTIVINYRFLPENTLNDIVGRKTTMTMFVATAYRAMINSWHNIDNIGEKISSMRLWSAGGMPMPEKTEHDWKDMTGQWIYMAYGLTESTSPVTLWEYPYTGDLKLYKNIVSCGKTALYTTIKRGKYGELMVKGPQIVESYYHNKEDTENTFKNNGMKTGDIFTMDNSGYLYIIDRKKDLIDISGYKVWPTEIENVIRKNLKVEDVVVVSVKDEYKGEVPVAYVKLFNENNENDETKKEIIELCRNNMAKYKTPKDILFIDRIPTNASGKIKRSDIFKIVGEKI